MSVSGSKTGRFSGWVGGTLEYVLIQRCSRVGRRVGGCIFWRGLKKGAKRSFSAKGEKNHLYLLIFYIDNSILFI